VSTSLLRNNYKNHLRIFVLSTGHVISKHTNTLESCWKITFMLRLIQINCKLPLENSSLISGWSLLLGYVSITKIITLPFVWNGFQECFYFYWYKNITFMAGILKQCYKENAAHVGWMGWWWRQYTPLKRRSTPTWLNGATSQKNQLNMWRVPLDKLLRRCLQRSILDQLKLHKEKQTTGK
jgi:hypothetical protein